MDKLLDVLVNRSPELVALVWAIWYTGKKLDALTGAIGDLNKKVAVLLDRAGLGQ
jgi:hypothetical protein